MPQKALDITKLASGVLIAGDPDKPINSISIDSRALVAGELFIPISGSFFDGHDFIGDALERGATGFITERWDDKIKMLAGEFEGSLAIKVKDSLAALQQIASGLREQSRAKVVGVTGSTGKTCTKILLESILAKSFDSVAASPKNFNNEIGVPLTIIKAKPEVDAFIIEMGMRGIGQISALCDIAHPDIGIITNVGDTHVGIVGSRELIAQAKGELLKSLPSEGFAVLNSEDAFTPALSQSTNAAVATFGLSPAATIYASDIYLDKDAKATFILHLPGEKITVKLPVPGEHAVYNALAAAAAASCLGIDSALIEEGLAQAEAAEMRLNIGANKNGVVIINDTYNANPASMKAALETAAAIEGAGRRVAVLGDMAELGTISAKSHYEVGKIAAESGLDLLVTIGPEAQTLNQGAIDAGLAKDRVHYYSDKEEALEFLLKFLKPKDLVLVKASRFMRFEQIVERLNK